jgi:hypothetical protein
MHDEILARAPALIGVMHAGVHERLLDPVAVDRRRGLVRVLLDDRKQVAEQPPLGRGQLGALDVGLLIRMGDAIDRRPRRREQRRP